MCDSVYRSVDNWGPGTRGTDLSRFCHPGRLAPNTHISRNTFPILSKDPSFQKTIKNPRKTDPVLKRNDG